MNEPPKSEAEWKKNSVHHVGSFARDAGIAKPWDTNDPRLHLGALSKATKTFWVWLRIC